MHTSSDKKPYHRRVRPGIRTWLPGLLCVVCVGTGAAQTTGAFQSLLDQGQSLYAGERFTEAESVLAQAVELQPKSAVARYWLGMAYYKLEQDKDAEKQFREAIRRDRASPDGYIGLGRVLMRTKNRMVDARQTLQDALKYDPANAEVYYILGLSYMEQSKRDLAAPLYVMQGRKAFQNAAANDPQHPDAYYQLALSYEYPSRDYKKALSIYYRQLSVNPGHREALSHFGKCAFLTGQYREGVDLLKQLIDIHGDALPSYAQTLMKQLNASYLQAQKQYDQAIHVYEEYLESLSPEERGLYTDLSYVASGEELRAYEQAFEVDKAEIRRRFWASRDPDPATVVNERLVEHYRRVIHAREHYARGQYPWDRRGDIYIRFGDPDDLQHFIIRTGEKALENYQPTGDARIDAIRERNHILRYRLKVDNAGAAWGVETTRKIIDPATDERIISQQASNNMNTFMLQAGNETQALAFVAESWVYVQHDLELFFVDQLGLGKFDYPLDIHETNIEEASLQNRYHPQRMAEDLVKRVPESYSFDYAGLPLEFLYDAVTYKGEEGRTRMEVDYTVPTRQLGTVSDGQGLHTWFDSHVVLRDNDFRRIANASERIGPIERPMNKAEGKMGVDLRTASLSLNAPAGTYNSAVEVRDAATRRIGIFQQSLTVPDYTGTALSMSDIKLATSIRPQADPGPFVRHGLEIAPNPSRLYERSDPVHFYYEIYNLQRDDTGRTAYRVELVVTTQEKRPNLIWRFLAGIGKLIKRSDEDQSVLLIFEDEGTAPDEYKYMSIDTGESPAGAYELTLTITDLHSGQIMTRTKAFVVTNDRMRWFNDEGAQPGDTQ